MKRLIMLCLMLAVAAGSAEVYSQGWLKSLGKKVKETAKNALERKVEESVDRNVEETFDKGEEKVKNLGKKKNKKKNSEEYDDSEYEEGYEEEGSEEQVAPKSLEATYAKCDFVAGDEIIFDDNLANEQLGEFPSQWDLVRGNAEIATVAGEKVICLLGEDSWITPLMKTPKNYLGDVFTIEFDFMCPKQSAGGSSFELDFLQPDAQRDNDTYTITWGWSDYERSLNYSWVNTSEERSSGEGGKINFADGAWHHIALSFNKRALKVYLDGSRVANIPNVKAGVGWVTWWSGHGDAGKDKYLKNVRIAKGAVPLYDRMMSEGKFITYGITFDVGKSTIKPESMGEINRIGQLMTENPDLKFSVEGHTDSTGNAASNQTLSEARSKAIVDKLVSMGIAADRLSASGKGQNSPIADNGTEEGRAKNRRVEFVKQ